jgi:hypothetical protein
MWIAIAVVLLYALSVGPTCRSPAGMAHRPLYLMARSRIPGELLASYLNLWLPRKDFAIWDARMGIIVIEGNSLE